SDGAALDQTAHFGQLGALASLGDGTDWEDVGMAGTSGLEVYEVGGGLAVERRFGIRHARHRGDTARECGCGSGSDGLVLLATRLPQMNVHVDQTRTDNLAARVEHTTRLQLGRRAD